ncbi:MFS transporter [Thermofilum pendens]|uniref:Lysosomal dipeptide transporter MFSD1 n=1 Tax=Thermofilum pendens (strain DSM 2475 / Hrk 5) TaxID=368408 RepID=A1S188_THEPD|nr:MFS transporter [Thermofilum pendens]ABL79218.1 major facilitator superfamily MFS_1 [Thermofilum pendens Hrk 5]
MERKLLYSITSLYVAYFLVYVHRTMTGVVQEELGGIASAHGLPPAAFTSIVAAAYFYTYAAMQLPAGILADALGAKRYVGTSMLLLGLGSALASTCDPTLILVGRLVIGVGAASVWVSLQRVIGVYAEKNVGATLTGLALAVGNLGALFATAPLREAVDAVGLRAVFLYLAVAAFILSVAAFLGINDPGISRGSLKRGLAETLRQLKVVARSRHSIALALAFAGTYSAVLAFQSLWASIYVSRYFPEYRRETPLLLLLLALAFLVSVPLVGYVSDAVLKKRKPVLLAGIVLHFLAWVGLLVASRLSLGLAELEAIFLLLGVVAATHMVIPPLSREAYSPEFSGTTLAFVNMVGFVAIAVYQSIGAVVGDPSIPLVVFALVSLAALLLSGSVRETLS